MKKLVFNSMFFLALVPLSLLGQQEEIPDLNEQLRIVEEQMSKMLENFGDLEDHSSFFFSDSLEINDLNDFKNIPMDSLLQGFSFLIPGVETDSLWQKGFGSQEDFFGDNFQNQLDQMFRSFEDLDPSYFQGMEDLLKQLQENGIRPDGENPVKPGKKKKKVYKL